MQIHHSWMIQGYLVPHRGLPRSSGTALQKSRSAVGTKCESLSATAPTAAQRKSRNAPATLHRVLLAGTEDYRISKTLIVYQLFSNMELLLDDCQNVG